MVAAQYTESSDARARDALGPRSYICAETFALERPVQSVHRGRTLNRAGRAFLRSGPGLCDLANRSAGAHSMALTRQIGVIARGIGRGQQKNRNSR